MNPLPEKKHFTAKECADAWGLTVQDLLQYGAYGKIELMVYLELTEGTMYVFRKGERLREEIKRSAWGDFQILSPMVCRDLQVNPDKLCPVTSIEPDQTIKKLYEDDDLLGIDLFQPIIKNGERRYQMIKYKDLWISSHEKQRFDLSVQKQLKEHQSNFLKKDFVKRRKNHCPELHKIFWRAFLSLKSKNLGNDPQYTETWNAVFYDCKMYLKDDDPRKILRRDFDENEIIDFITLNDHPHPRIEWSLELEQGTYKFSSFKSLLTRLKNKPPF